jgi:hypothetical protein
MLKCKILIKLFVLSCLLIYCVYGDTIQAEVLVMCLTHFHFLPSDVRFQHRAPTFTFLQLTLNFSTAQLADTTLTPLLE